MPWMRAAAIGAQVADALAAAHALGIIHRDLKPDNVMLVKRDDGSELAKVLDFGLARISENAPTTGKTIAGTAGSQPEQKLTRVGTIIGTPGYMAPEQAIGDVVDHRTDLYALGVILWEMLVGRTLFDGDDFQTIVARQFGSTIEAPSRAGDPAIPEPLDRLVLSLLAARAVDRPERASAVRDLLHELVIHASRGELARTGTHPALGGAPLDAIAVDRTVMAHSSSLPSGSFQAAARPSDAGTGHVAHALPEPLARLLSNRRALVGIALAAVLGVGVLFVGVAAITSGGGDAPASGGILAPLGPRLSPELSAAVETLSTSSDRRAREAAATLLLAAPASEPVPAYAKALAELDRARSCRSKKEIVVRLGEIGDDDALPYLRRLRDTPRNGCGFLGTRDCLGCLRDELETAYGASRRRDFALSASRSFSVASRPRPECALATNADRAGVGLEALEPRERLRAGRPARGAPSASSG